MRKENLKSVMIVTNNFRIDKMENILEDCWVKNKFYMTYNDTLTVDEFNDLPFDFVLTIKKDYKKIMICVNNKEYEVKIGKTLYEKFTYNKKKRSFKIYFSGEGNLIEIYFNYHKYETIKNDYEKYLSLFE
jgi:hypothetical protein